MTPATLSSSIKTEHRRSFAASPPPRTVAKTLPLLLLSNDETLCQDLLAAATENGLQLIRMPATTDAPRRLRILKPAAVLLDLDPPSKATWDTADLLSQDEHCPLLLPPGTYEYRFVVDGAWMPDPAAIATAPNPFGELNSVLKVNAAST